MAKGLQYSTQEQRNLYPKDLMLRKNGFRIHARPKQGPVMWERKGTLFTEQHAYQLALQELQVRHKDTDKEGKCSGTY